MHWKDLAYFKCCKLLATIRAWRIFSGMNWINFSQQFSLPKICPSWRHLKEVGPGGVATGRWFWGLMPSFPYLLLSCLPLAFFMQLILEALTELPIVCPTLCLRLDTQQWTIWALSSWGQTITGLRNSAGGDQGRLLCECSIWAIWPLDGRDFSGRGSRLCKGPEVGTGLRNKREARVAGLEWGRKMDSNKVEE